MLRPCALDVCTTTHTLLYWTVNGSLMVKGLRIDIYQSWRDLLSAVKWMRTCVLVCIYNCLNDITAHSPTRFSSPSFIVSYGFDMLAHSLM